MALKTIRLFAQAMLTNHVIILFSIIYDGAWLYEKTSEYFDDNSKNGIA